MAVISDSGVMRLPQPETRQLGTKPFFCANYDDSVTGLPCFLLVQYLAAQISSDVLLYSPAVKFAEKAYIACLEALDALVTEFAELEAQLMKGTEVFVGEHDGGFGSTRMLGTLEKVESVLRKEPTVNRKWQVKILDSGQLKIFSQNTLTPLRGPLVNNANEQATTEIHNSITK